jgi:hypothetical protein
MIRPHFSVLIALVLGISLGSEAGSAQAGKKAPRAKEPAWYIAPPEDKVNVIARGKAEASDMQVAIDEAVVEARGAFALKVESSWQQLLDSLGKEMPNCGAPLLASTEVALAGTKVRQQKTTKRGTIFTAYVLVSWPKASLAAALLARVQEDAEWYDEVKGTMVVRELAKKR